MRRWGRRGGPGGGKPAVGRVRDGEAARRGPRVCRGYEDPSDLPRVQDAPGNARRGPSRGQDTSGVPRVQSQEGDEAGSPRGEETSAADGRDVGRNGGDEDSSRSPRVSRETEEPEGSNGLQAAPHIYSWPVSVLETDL